MPAEHAIDALYAHAGRALAALYSTGPGTVFQCGDHWWLSSIDDPEAEHSMVGVSGDPVAAAAATIAGAAWLRANGRPVLICAASAVSAAVELVAGPLGLRRAGLLSHLSLALDEATPAAADHTGDPTIRRVTDAADWSGVLDVWATGFGWPRADVERQYQPALLERVELPIVAVWRAGEIVAACALHVEGELAYLMHMATKPDWRCRGLGFALVRSALGLAGAAGATTAHLVASPDGLRLYPRLGFRLDDLGSIWMCLPRAAVR